MLQDLNRQSGYGFVHFAITPSGVESAICAASELNDMTVDNINYKCSISHNLNRRLSSNLPVADHTCDHKIESDQQRRDFNNIRPRQYFVDSYGAGDSTSSLYGFPSLPLHPPIVGGSEFDTTSFIDESQINSFQATQGIAFSQMPGNNVGGFIVVPAANLLTSSAVNHDCSSPPIVMRMGTSCSTNANQIPVHQIMHSPLSSLSSVSTEAVIDDSICPANYLFYSPNPMHLFFPGSPNTSSVPALLNAPCLDNFPYYKPDGSFVTQHHIISHDVHDLMPAQNSVLCGMDQRVTAGLLHRNSVQVSCNKMPSKPSRNIINRIRSKLDIETKNTDLRSSVIGEKASVKP